MAKKTKKNKDIIRVKQHFNKQLEEMKLACMLEKVELLTETEKRIKEHIQKSRRQERTLKVFLLIVFIGILVVLDIKDKSLLINIAQLMFGMQ